MEPWIGQGMCFSCGKFQACVMPQKHIGCSLGMLGKGDEIYKLIDQQDSLCGGKLGAKLQNELVKQWFPCSKTVDMTDCTIH